MSGRQHPEFALQRQIAAALGYARPGVLWWHTPNEGKRRMRQNPRTGAWYCAEGARLKQMGMRPGVSDFLFVLPPTGRIAALEIKAAGGKPTELQVEFLNGVISAGGLAEWCDSFEDAVTILRGWRVLR